VVASKADGVVTREFTLWVDERMRMIRIASVRRKAGEASLAEERRSKLPHSQMMIAWLTELIERGE
jgi:hypothetical protein